MCIHRARRCDDAGRRFRDRRGQRSRGAGEGHARPRRGSKHGRCPGRSGAGRRRTRRQPQYRPGTARREGGRQRAQQVRRHGHHGRCADGQPSRCACVARRWCRPRERGLDGADLRRHRRPRCSRDLPAGRRRAHQCRVAERHDRADDGRARGPGVHGGTADRQGADVNHRNQNGASALDWALRGNEKKMAEQLRRAGARD